MRPVAIFFCLLITSLFTALANAAEGQSPPSIPGCSTTDCRLQIVVSLSKQRVRVFKDGVRLLTSKASTGLHGRETPRGVYNVKMVLPAFRETRRWTIHRGPAVFFKPSMPILAVPEKQTTSLGRPATHGSIWVEKDAMKLLFRAVTEVGVESSWVLIQ